MKKSLISLLILGLVAMCLLVSCNQEVVQSSAEELVSISFEEGSSRALSATLESFDKGNYYWKYAAKKADSSNLLSGQTAGYDTSAEAREAGARWVKEGYTGLGSGAGTAQDPYVAYKVQGFSQGLWNFTLYAYKRTGEGTELSPYVYTLVYQGETTGVLITAGTNGSHSVNVVVSPVQSGNGTLSVLITGDNKITLNPATPLPEQVLANAKIQLGIDKLGTTPTVIRELSFIDADYCKDDLEPGTYKVSVQFTNDDATVVYASGSVVATVYSGLTTTVSGNLSEVVTYIEFDAEQNPDIITKTAGVDDITSETTGDTQGNITLSEPSTVPDEEKKVSATLPAAAAVAMLPKVGENPDPNASMSLELNVDTKDSTSTSVTYEISMTKIVTLNSEVTTSDVETLGTYTEGTVEKKYYAIATIKLSPGLTGVTVTHDGHAMVESTSTTADEGYGVYSYDATTGILTIQTNTFSPFEVRYNASAVAAIGSALYKTLADAVAAVPTNGTETTITMINDASVVAGITIAADKNVVLELNGHTISGNTDSTSTYALITNKGTLTIQDSTDTEKNGTGSGLLTTYISNPDQQEVPGYASNTITNNGTLTVESGKIVNNGAGYACYAIDNQTNGNLYIPVLIINGGRFEQMNAYTYAIRMFCNSTTKTNSVTVNGGVITGGYGLWLQTPNANANKAELVINGGTLEANDGAALYVGGTTADNSQISIDITGGIINGTGVIIQGPLSGEYGHISVSGGRIVNVQCGANVDNFIIGGTFNHDPSAYVAGGYVAVPDDEENPTLWTIETIEDRFAELAEAKNLTITSEVGIEDYHTSADDFVSKKGLAYVNCVSTDSSDVAVYRLYEDGKLYLLSLENYTGTQYTVSGVDGIRAWGNSTITDITIDCDLEQAYNKFKQTSQITKVTFTNNVTTIPCFLFSQGTSITEIVIPESVTTINAFAFANIPTLTSFTVMDDSKIDNQTPITLRDSCLRSCPSLSTIDIQRPAVIGNYFGRSCTSLSTVYLKSAEVTFTGDSQVFNHQDSGQNAGVTVYVANEAVKEALKTASSSSLDEWIIIIQ